MHYGLFILFSLFAFLALPHVSYAASAPNCTPLYGGGQSCEQFDPIFINKTVQNPQTKGYVENLSPTDPQYTPGQTIVFKLTITNTGTSTVSKITATDILPPYITFSKGQGTYDEGTKTLRFTIDQLKANETKVFFIEGKVVERDALPDAQQSRCVINQATATANNKTSQDNALICLAKDPLTGSTSQIQTTKGGLVIHPPAQSKTTPSTGPEALAIAALLPLGGLGFFLRFKAKT
jgi:uncharacterized repeat protein (TIGR01451 family)